MKILLQTIPEVCPIVPPMPGTYLYGEIAGRPDIDTAEDISKFLQAAQEKHTNVCIKDAWWVRIIINQIPGPDPKGNEQRPFQLHLINALTRHDSPKGETYFIPVTSAIFPSEMLRDHLDKETKETAAMMISARSNLRA